MPDLPWPDGTLATTYIEKAFNIPSIPQATLKSKLFEIHNISKVERPLSKLNMKKAAGDNGVPMSLLHLPSRDVIALCIHDLLSLV